MCKQLILATLSFLGLCSCQQKTDNFQSVDVAAFSEIIAQPNVQRLDVRTAEEYHEGHIPGSINIDVKTDSFDRQANALLSADSPVALYCRSGRRSKIAAKKLSDMGFNVIELSTGFNGWTDANGAIERP